MLLKVILKYLFFFLGLCNVKIDKLSFINFNYKLIN